MKCSEIKVIKKDGTKEEFNVQKVLAAVNKSANRAMIIFSKAESKFICEFVEEKAEELDQSEVPIAKADAKTGTFRIGLRLVEPTMNRYVRVNWTAIRDAKEKVHDVEETALLIRPDILYLKTRETFFLEPEFRGIAPTPVTWSIREENGGTIEPNGKYTAPNVPGIFEVSAASTRYENLRASIYVVVRDGE